MLKHYRNQFIHGMLDRFATLQLLRWGRQGTIAEEFTVEEQKKFIEPLHNIIIYQVVIQSLHLQELWQDEEHTKNE